MTNLSLRGNLVKSRSLSDLSIIGEEDTEALTYTFDNRNERFHKSPKAWKTKIINFLDDIEVLCNKSPNELRKLFASLCFRKNTPQLLFYFLLVLLIIFYSFINLHNHYHHQYQYSNAYDQSFGLFQHINNHHWEKLKDHYHSSSPHKFGTVNTFIDDPNVWYQYNWNKNFVCPQEERIGISPTNGGGELGDGPKWVCNSRDIVRVVNNRMKHRSLDWTKDKISEVTSKGNYRKRADNGCLIYSIGVNAQHLGFEMGIQDILTKEAERTIENYEKGKPFCSIHVFDPDGYHERLVISEGIHYHNWGIKSSKEQDTGENEDQGDVRFKTFQQTVKELDHEGYVVDIMKVDCKMCEWSIYEDWFENGRDYTKQTNNDPHQSTKGLSSIQQLLVEVHGTPEPTVNEFFERITKENYVIFHKDANTEKFAGASQDYAFLKLASAFFQKNN